jgi:hypothetical protein
MSRRRSRGRYVGRKTSREWDSGRCRIYADAKINGKLGRGPLTVAKWDTFDLRADISMTFFCIDRGFAAIAGRDNE